MSQERVLDARPSRNPGRAKYSIRARVAPQEPRRKLWAGPAVRIDQGWEGACVGFMMTNEAMASPARVKLADPNAYAREFYRECLRVDEYPGEADEGTSIDAGARVGMSRGWYDGYDWADSMDEVRDGIIAVGPVGIGIPWFDSMYETDHRGWVKVAGRMVGFHAILLTGYTPKWHGVGWYRWRNSWGRTYGINGDAWIPEPELAGLLSQYRIDGQPLDAVLFRGRHDLRA